MKHLKGYGYKVPENKGDYDGKIENLPKLIKLVLKNFFGGYIAVLLGIELQCPERMQIPGCLRTITAEGYGLKLVLLF